MSKTVAAFLSEAGRLCNSGEARVLVMAGNVYDLFPGPDNSYQALPDVLVAHWQVPSRIVVTYEINGPLRIHRQSDRQLLKDAWLKWRHGLDSGDLALARLAANGVERDQLIDRERSFDEQLQAVIGRPTVALELMRQLCLCSRTSDMQGKPLLQADLVLIIEAADLIVPEAPIAGMGDADRQRLHICHDWFSDPGFASNNDVVVMLSESSHAVNRRLSRLPQVAEVPIEEPNAADRLAFLQQQLLGVDTWQPSEAQLQEIATSTAGLNLQSLRQLCAAAKHEQRLPDADDVVRRVEHHIQSKLGEDVVRFKRPQQQLQDVVGNARLLDYLRNDLMPRIQRGGAGALSGCAVSGPIGAGKTFIFEALAGELGLPVLELGNIRSQWFGQTDVILESLRRVLVSLGRVVIIVDEADTQFGGLGGATHDTERRLTGKIQAMMSDPQLLGKTFWLLMTARIHRLSPDLRRPGRVGDLIVPVLDPEPDDREAFIQWVLGECNSDQSLVDDMQWMTADWSAAAYASLRREIAAMPEADADSIRAVVADLLPAAIAQTRRYQTLQALVNCTRRSLLPVADVTEEMRAQWRQDIKSLELLGED